MDLPNDDDFYHSDVIRSKLIRNISITFKEIHEELIHALEDLIPTVEDSRWQILSEMFMTHGEGRLGQGPNRGYHSTSDLQCHEPCVRWCSSVSVIILQLIGPFELRWSSF